MSSRDTYRQALIADIEEQLRQVTRLFWEVIVLAFLMLAIAVICLIFVSWWFFAVFIGLAVMNGWAAKRNLATLDKLRTLHQRSQHL